MINETDKTRAEEFARNIYSKTDPVAIGKFVDLSVRQAEFMQAWLLATIPEDAQFVIDPRLNENGEYYITGADINAILKGAKK